MDLEKISLQIYTARNFKPYENIIKFLSDQGMKKIELFEVEAFSETKELLDKYGMSSPSSHIGFSTLKDTKSIINKLKFSNITTAIVPSPVGKPGGKFSSLFDKTEDEWNVFGKLLSSYVDIFQDNGINLGYHNHSFEFNPLPSGKMPIECILDHNENLKFEIDLGWTVAGKSDPIFWINKYSSKIIACHLKDFTSQNLDLIDHDSQCSIGEGFINWKEILTEVLKTNCDIFSLEHDNPKDYKDYVIKSLQFLKSLEV